MHSHGLYEVFNNMLGQEPWRVEVAIGTRVSMEFGLPTQGDERKIIHGQWHLLMQNCTWRIENDEKVLLGAEDDHLSDMLKEIHFGKLRSMQLVSPANDLRMEFDGALRMITFSSYSSKSDDSLQWYLFCPDNTVWMVDGGGLIACKNRYEPR